MQSGPPPPKLPKIQPPNGACLPRRFSALLCESAFPSCVPVGSYSGWEARSLSFLPSLPFLPAPWGGSEVSRAGQGGVFPARFASLLSKAPGMGFQLLNPGAAAARTLRTRCGGCGDSLGAQGFGTSPFAASALPRPPPRFPCSEVLGASHPLGLPGPRRPPAVSAIHHGCQPPLPPPSSGAASLAH